MSTKLLFNEENLFIIQPGIKMSTKLLSNEENLFIIYFAVQPGQILCIAQVS